MTGAFFLFEGKVISVERRTEGGWVRGHALIAGLGPESERRVRVDFQNEHLLARAAERPDAEFAEFWRRRPT